MDSLSQKQSNAGLEDKLKSLGDKLHRMETEKLNTLSNEVIYLKEVIDFQNSKIDKLTSLITDVLKQDNNVLTLSAIQEGISDVNVSVPNNSMQVGNPTNSRLRHHQQPQINSIQTNGNSISPSHEQQHQLSHLDGSLHPQLHVDHQVMNHSVNDMPTSQVDNVSITDLNFKQKELSKPPSAETRRPKITIDFIHNPMTVREIYDEYTKGFKGQPPLCELDQKFGKLRWRGDSRSKESKRYQRRKRLCDAIKRGMQKYNKSEDEIINYIEEFRGDKSLTWVMNGNLPPDI